MISFVQPSSIDIDNVTIPLAFPYIVAFLQGKPQHNGDDFSIKHPPMERGKRAKIFAPFDALDGYGDAVRSKNVIYTNKVELDESEKAELNRRLSILHNLTYNRRMTKKNHERFAAAFVSPVGNGGDAPDFSLSRPEGQGDRQTDDIAGLNDGQGAAHIGLKFVRIYGFAEPGVKPADHCQVRTPVKTADRP